MRRLRNGIALVVALLLPMILGAAASAQFIQYGGGPDMPIDARTKASTIDALVKGLRNAYVFPDIGDTVAAMLAGRRARGEYNSVTSAKSFSELLTQQMFDIAHDKHLRVRYSSQVIPPIPASEPGTAPRPDPHGIQQMQRQMRKDIFAFEKVEHLPGNIGYLKLNAFLGTELGGGETAAAAMGFLANTDALIIDLRQNGGGGPRMLDVCGTFQLAEVVAKPLQLNDHF